MAGPRRTSGVQMTNPLAGVGCTNNETLRAARGEVVDGRERFFAVDRANLDEGEAELLRRLFGERPLKLEPRLLGLLHQESDLDGGCGVGGESQHSERGKGTKSQEKREFHGNKGDGETS